jgi:hypothetical protein
VAFGRQVIPALPLAGLSLQAVAASLVMGAALFVIRDSVTVWLAIPAGALVYALVIGLLARRQLKDLVDLNPGT